MKFAYAATTAALTAILCLSTPAQAKCDSGHCTHGRTYQKPVKAKTAVSKSKATSTTSRAIKAKKTRKTAQIQRVKKAKPAKTARHYRKPKAVASVKTVRIRKVSTSRVALKFPVTKEKALAEITAPRKSTSHAAHPNGQAGTVVTMIKTMAPQYGVPTWFALRIAKIESGYNPTVRGAAGEYGVFQIKCPTARGLGFEGDCGGLSDARTNVRWGLEHLSAALKKSGGNMQLAASKHNGGLGRKTIIRKYVNLVF